MRVLLVLLFALVVAASPVGAEYKNPMKFSIGYLGIIFADREIDSDVATRFAAFLKEHKTRDRSYIILNSPGGDLDAGFAFGRLLRAHKFQANVGIENPDIADITSGKKEGAPTLAGECISSCTFVYMGAQFRSLDQASRYGIHQFYFDGELKNPAQIAQVYSGTIAAYLKEMGIQPEFLTMMSRVNPENYLFVGLPDLRKLGIVNDGALPTSWTIDSFPDGKGLYLKAEKEELDGPIGVLFSCGDKGLVLVVSMTRDNINNPPILATKAHLLMTMLPYDPNRPLGGFRDLDIAPWFQRFQVQSDTYVASFLIPVTSAGLVAEQVASAATVGYQFDTEEHQRQFLRELDLHRLVDRWRPSKENYEFFIYGLSADDNDRRKIKGFFDSCHFPDWRSHLTQPKESQ